MTIKKCKLKGCNRECYTEKHGLCNAHYLRYLRHGNKMDTSPIAKRLNRAPYKHKD